MTAHAPTPWCPSTEHKPAHLKPEADKRYWRCPACGMRHAACLVRARPGLYAEPVAHMRPGFDPISGAETQDLPR